MKPQEVLGRARTPEGAELLLLRKDTTYQIRVDGFELMSSHAHGSEEDLARLACAGLENRPGARVLVGGLGLGYTLRAALDLLPRRARVEVAEVIPAVAEWNRGPLAHLARSPLDDTRVRLHVADVVDVIEASERPFHAILLDVDNGPDGLTLDSNRRLYSAAGLARLHAALEPDGVLGVWSPDFDRDFLRHLRRNGFETTSESVPVRPGRSRPRHTIYVARRGNREPAPRVGPGPNRRGSSRRGPGRRSGRPSRPRR